MSARSVLVINGSPKRGRSTSSALCHEWVVALSAEGVDVSEVTLSHALARAGAGRQELLAYTAQADTWVLVFPLYVDTVPGIVMEALELIAAHSQMGENQTRKRLVVMVNAGFPEKWHCEIAVDVCRHFGAACGVDWAGSISIGMGAIIDAKPLEHVAVAKGLRQAIAIAARSLGEGGSVPARAVELGEAPMLPVWLYTAWANLSFHWEMLRHGAWRQRKARPFSPDRPRSVEPAESTL